MSYSASGDIEACLVFGGRGEEKLTGIVMHAQRGIFAVGYTKSVDFPTKQPVQATLAGPRDLFLTRLALSTFEMTLSTFFGGTGDDSGWGIAMDNGGNPIVAGATDSKDLPGTSQGYQRSSGGRTDAFVTRFEGKHHRQVRSTYFGGSNDDESGYDGGNIKVDRYGKIWLTGITMSPDLPTRNPSQPRFGGGDGDGFVAAFSTDLKNPCFSSYHGGQERDILEGLEISESGTMAATGVSFSKNPSVVSIRVGQTPVYVGATMRSCSVATEPAGDFISIRKPQSSLSVTFCGVPLVSRPNRTPCPLPKPHAIIDEDLGRSASVNVAQIAFQKMVAKTLEYTSIEWR